jgi:hypothetical protein
MHLLCIGIPLVVVGLLPGIGVIGSNGYVTAFMHELPFGRDQILANVSLPLPGQSHRPAGAQ